MKLSPVALVLGAAALAISIVNCSASSPMSPATSSAGTTGATGAAGTGIGSTAGTSGSVAGTSGGGAGTSSVAGTTGGGAAGTNAAAGTMGGGAGSSAGTGASGAGAAGTGGGAGAGGVESAMPSAGCGKAPTIAKGQFVVSQLMGRNTWVRLPAAYDPSRAYPLIFAFKGCGGGGAGNFGLDTVAGNEAIIASMDFPPGATCYDTADGAKFVDLPVFDALLDQINANHCVDRNHVFATGFSSGAWLAFFLGCQRGDVLRGIGTVAGGMKPTFFLGAPQCKGTGLIAMMVSDLDDHENPFFDEDKDGDSVEIGVNHYLVLNGCTEKMWTMTAGTASQPDPSICRSYAGCGRNPVRLCLTMGKGHSAQESLSFPGFWQLFKQSLPK